MIGMQLKTRPSHPRLLSDEQIREAHRKYMDSDRGLRSVALEYGISHVQLGAGFARLRLPAKGNRATDPVVVAEVLALRSAGHTWPAIARRTNLSLRQVQNIHRRHNVEPFTSGPGEPGRDSKHSEG